VSDPFVVIVNNKISLNQRVTANKETTDARVHSG
jgi:hypothetical protein